MVSAVWAGGNALAVTDGEETLASGRVSERGGEWVIEQAGAKPSLDCAYGDFLVRLLIRRAYELGGYEQTVYAAPGEAGFYEKLGFAREAGQFAIETGAGPGARVKMKRAGDITGRC